MSRLARGDGTAEPVSRDQILRRERGQGNNNFPCSADHEQDWQPYPIDPYYFAIYVCDHTRPFENWTLPVRKVLRAVKTVNYFGIKRTTAVVRVSLL